MYFIKNSDETESCLVHAGTIVAWMVQLYTHNKWAGEAFENKINQRVSKRETEV